MTEDSTQDRWWLTWSPKQASLHIEREAVGLKLNSEAFARGLRNDCLTIGVSDSSEAANEMAERLRPIAVRHYEARARASASANPAEQPFEDTEGR